MKHIPVLRPRLPDADALVTYLRRIDSTRVYSNFGPLNLELNQRLANRFERDAETVVCAGSGTAALVGAILATAGRAGAERPIALVPAFTFVATALAAEQCGYEVQFCDVDPGHWQIDPDHVAQLIRDNRQIGLVLPVASFGRTVDLEAWSRLQAELAVPVVVDGAACFESVLRQPSQYHSAVPVALSFHATKSFATAEGGCVLCTDAEQARRITRSLNFGFYNSRECEVFSINGKLSEYHAAVGLAELDGWETKSTAFQGVVRSYRKEITELGAAHMLHCAPEICSSYVLLECANDRLAPVIGKQLIAADIGFRHWYGESLNRHRHFHTGSSGPMPVAERLARSVVGLPMAPDLEHADIQRVVRAVGEALSDAGGADEAA
jgi:dTDP-4-amino-4,6-dideoxygalactose transaminase